MCMFVRAHVRVCVRARVCLSRCVMSTCASSTDTSCVQPPRRCVFLSLSPSLPPSVSGRVRPSTHTHTHTRTLAHCRHRGATKLQMCALVPCAPPRTMCTAYHVPPPPPPPRARSRERERAPARLGGRAVSFPSSLPQRSPHTHTLFLSPSLYPLAQSFSLLPSPFLPLSLTPSLPPPAPPFALPPFLHRSLPFSRSFPPPTPPHISSHLLHPASPPLFLS